MGLRERYRARRWQRWTEVDPEDDYGRFARLGAVFAFAFFLGVIALVVVGLVVAR